MSEVDDNHEEEVEQEDGGIVKKLKSLIGRG